MICGFACCGMGMGVGVGSAELVLVLLVPVLVGDNPPLRVPASGDVAKG